MKPEAELISWKKRWYYHLYAHQGSATDAAGCVLSGSRSWQANAGHYNRDSVGRHNRPCASSPAIPSTNSREHSFLWGLKRIYSQWTVSSTAAYGWKTAHFIDHLEDWRLPRVVFCRLSRIFLFFCFLQNNNHFWFVSLKEFGRHVAKDRYQEKGYFYWY